MLPVIGIELVEALVVRCFELRVSGAALEPEDLPVVVALDVVMELDELLLERSGAASRGVGRGPFGGSALTLLSLSSKTPA